jgi:uncharacterized protein involved in oxidation of intracellular sulfur
MKKVLLIVNGPAYGADRTFNAVRLAVALVKRNDVDVTVFPTGTRSLASSPGQKTPERYYAGRAPQRRS